MAYSFEHRRSKVKHEEQETILNYDVQTQTWYCYSAYPAHIRALEKFAQLYNVECTYTSEGCVKVQLPKRGVAFRKPVSARRSEQARKNLQLV